MEIHLSDKLHRSDYERFVPEIDRRVQQHGKIRLLVVMEDFHGWDVGALWEDLKFDLRHFNDIERLALVGDRKWEKGMSAFCKPFTTAEIRYFDRGEIEAARRWVESGLTEPSGSG